MKKRILMVLGILFVATVAMAQYEAQGTWEWQYSLLESGERIDPSTEGYTRQLYFGELDDRSFIEYRNGVILLVGIWGLSYVVVDEFCYELLGAWSDSGEFIVEGFPSFPVPDTMVISGFIEEHFNRRGPVSNEMINWGALKKSYK